MQGRQWAALAVAALLIAGAPACSPNDPPGGGDRYSIATGGSGGVYQVYGGGLAELMTDELADAPTTAETTSASVDNLTLVAERDSDVAFTLSDTAIDAVEGQAGFDEPLALRALATIYPNITQVAVKADSGIERIEDLEGRTVSVGSPNSGTEVIALRLLEVAGLDPDEDIGERGLGVGESVQALRDGSIDAFFWSGGVPTGAITDLTTTDDIRLLPLDGYLDPLRERYGEAYEEAEIEEGEYTGVAATKTIGVPNLLMVTADMPDDLAFRITKLLFDGKERLAAVHPAAESLDPRRAREVVAPVRAAPGRAALLRRGGRMRRRGAIGARRGSRRSPLRAPASRGGGDGPRSSCARRTGTPVAAAGRAAAASRSPTATRSTARRRRSASGRRGGGFALVAIASPSEAVLDYYAIDGRRARRGRAVGAAPGGAAALRHARAGRHRRSGAGRSWPAASARRCGGADGRAAHLRITVTGGGR